MPKSPVEIIRQYEATPEQSLFGPFKVLPGLNDEKIRAAEAKHGAPFPEALRSLLVQCAGLEFEAHEMHWEEIGALLELFPGSIHLMDDGSGNFWMMELSPDRLGPIWFYCHDPAVIMYQAHDLAGFLENILSGKELVARDGEIWRLGAKGGQREDDWVVFDLSEEKIGSGAPMCLYYDEIFGLQRVGNSLKFRIKHRERNWWQRFRDEWR